MPLQSAHVFASHIGHTGKTTLCFQMSCYFARHHPELSVLVMDFAEEGDLTKRMLGGVDNSRQTVKEVFGTVFSLLDDAKTVRSGLGGWLWGTADLDLMKYAVRVHDHNPAIPENLFLISSGAWPRSEKADDLDVHRRMCTRIRTPLEKSETNWKLFCDTDGDRRPSAFTKIAYGLCSEAIVPMHLQKGDLDRTETMLGMLQELRREGVCQTQVLMVVWNFVKLQKGTKCTHKGVEFPFTPTAVSLDVLDACNKRLYAINRELEGLFVHGKASEADFPKLATTVLKSLPDNVLKPSEELGRPFVEIIDELNRSGKKTIKFQSGTVSYTSDVDTVGGVEDSMEVIVQKFENMSVGLRPGVGGA